MISSLDAPSEFSEDILEIVFGLCDTVGDQESVAFSFIDDVLYARIFDGERYVFPLPFMLSDSADASEACLSLAKYSQRELIPLIITDVPRDELDFLCSVFPHVDAYTYEDDDDSFYVKVNNECDMLTEVPQIEYNGITLSELLDSDEESYAELCADRELNKFWGYDVDCDNPDGNSQFYLDVVRREFLDGIAITLAIREHGEFVGEATIYNFDYCGGASIAVRVRRDCHSRGVGSRATEALIKLSKSIGLSTLYAEILNENEHSIKMTSKFMTLIKRTKSKTYFTLSLQK